MYTEIDKHCEIGHKRLLMSSIETENQLSYRGSTVIMQNSPQGHKCLELITLIQHILLVLEFFKFKKLNFYQ